jgi:hypothetical protein
VDTWDGTREAVEATLNLLPTPLPGFTSPAKVWRIVVWALKLTHSPRVSEADAGILSLYATQHTPSAPKCFIIPCR